MVHSATTKKRCPLCDKRCKNSTALLQHMNQPNGQCNPSLHPSIVRAAKQYHRRKVLEETTDPDVTTMRMDVDDYGEVPFLQRDTFMDGFHKDEYASERKTNLYYPFASAEEWELASDRELAQGPGLEGYTLEIQLPDQTTLTLYYRDPLECLQSLLGNPLVQDFIQYTPFRLWKSAEKLMRVYTEWLSGDVAWRMQASHHAFLLLALCPIPKFIEKDPEIRGVLESRIFHAVLDFVLRPLKTAARVGLRRLEKTTHPWNLRPYIKKAKQLRLNGVHRPFWQDWPLAEPSEFLTPEILHHWLKMFYDHVVKWCIAALGAAEIDFRFSVLWPHTGMRHFKEGISKSKQATGREHRDIMRYILPGFLKSIAALNTFFYHGQAPAIDEDVLDKMASALASGVRKGKKGPINNWHIPKLEFLQSVIPAIRANGVPLQWTADVTEHAHITEVKEPASNSNNQGYEAHICRNLDRRDKCHYFGLATAMDSSGVDLGVCVEGNDTDANPVDYFAESVSLLEGNHPNAPTPFRTFTSADTSTGFHLNRDHVGHRLSIEDAATKFDLPDLRDAILSFIQRPHDSLVIGGRRPNVEDDYRLSYLQVWHNFRIQTRSYHDPKRILVAETVNAEPPSKSWQFGRGDPVIVNADADFHWPKSGLAGHAVCQLKMIFHVVTGKGFVPPAGTDQFLAYVQRFDVVHQTDPDSGVRGLFRDPATTMYHMKRARRTNGSPMGDVVPLERLRAIVDLVPRSGKKANKKLTYQTILNYCDDFHLNHFYTKELFWALTQ
ncbi:hypothetical protein B0H13DRAFT_2242446 [Mycena leptocephala]|nr:hypothetical protein B0H13DRAFT_2242446 [Mycena leptocephala]